MWNSYYCYLIVRKYSNRTKTWLVIVSLATIIDLCTKENIHIYSKNNQVLDNYPVYSNTLSIYESCLYGNIIQ